MKDAQIVQIVALVGWLVLAGAALASYRLKWKESVRMLLLWAGIFVSAALAFSLAMG